MYSQRKSQLYHRHWKVNHTFIYRKVLNNPALESNSAEEPQPQSECYIIVMFIHRFGILTCYITQQLIMWKFCSDAAKNQSNCWIIYSLKYTNTKNSHCNINYNSDMPRNSHTSSLTCLLLLGGFNNWHLCKQTLQ